MKKLIQNKVDKKKIATFPTVNFPGRIVVVLSPTEAERVVDYLLSQPVLGFDTETRPSFKKGVHHKCSLLQVATASCCFLFRLNYIGICPAIKRLLEDNTVTKVGLAWNNDALGLHQLGKFEMGEFVDLQDMAHQLGIEDQSLMKLYANVFGERISKRQQLTNWERDVLEESQKRYAAIDAWACVRLYEEFKRMIETNDYQLVIVPEETTNQYEETIS
jgi:ribonuclease D